MGSPYHIPRCASHLLSCDEATVEFQAISLITESFAHPQRALLSAFVQQAVDRELAARFFLNDVVRQNKATVAESLADRISLLRKGPIVCENMDPSLRRSIWRRNEGRCCILKADSTKNYDEGPLPIYIVSPALFRHGDMLRDEKLYTMFAVYIGRSKLEFLKLLLDQDSDFPGHDPPDQLMLLSPQMLEHFANERLSLKANPLEATSNSFSLCFKTFKLF